MAAKKRKTKEAPKRAASRPVASKKPKKSATRRAAKKVAPKSKKPAKKRNTKTSRSGRAASAKPVAAGQPRVPAKGSAKAASKAAKGRSPTKSASAVATYGPAKVIPAGTVATKPAADPIWLPSPGPSASAQSLSVRVWIIEELSLRGTALSCVPKTLPLGAREGTCAWFDSEDTFVRAALKVFAEILRAPDGERHLLVISAHGKEKTGTLLEVSPDTHMRLDRHSDLFAIRPPGLVTIVSACWGGYPSVLGALRTGTSEPALVVAPLVNIHPDDINAIQADVVAAMLREERPDESIEAMVVKRDAILMEKHAGHALRVVRRDGTMTPPEGDAGLAQPMEGVASYRVVALHRLPAPNSEPPGIAVLLAPDGTFWRASLASICDGDNDDAVYALQGRVVTLRGKRLKYAEGVELGEFVEVIVMPDPPKAKVRKMPPPPYAHSVERTTAKRVEAALEVGAGSLKRCKRCNWASYSIKSVRIAGREIHDVRAVCHRDACDEHAKWPTSRPKGVAIDE